MLSSVMIEFEHNGGAMDLKDLETDEALLKELGSRLRHHRINAGLRQDDLAELAVLARSTVSKLERGKAVGVMEFLRYLRAIDLLESLDQVIWDASMSPVKLAKEQDSGRFRQRVRKKGLPAVVSGEFIWPEDR